MAWITGIALNNGNKGGDLQSAVQESSRLCLCGKCQGQVSRTKYGYRCGGCGRSVNERVSKKRVSPKDVKAIFENGVTGVIDGFSKKDGSAKFSAMQLFNEDDQCGFILWDQFAGKRLTAGQLKAILTKGKTGIIRGFISKGFGYWKEI